MGKASGQRKIHRQLFQKTRVRPAPALFSPGFHCGLKLDTSNSLQETASRPAEIVPICQYLAHILFPTQSPLVDSLVGDSFLDLLTPRILLDFTLFFLPLLG